MQFKPLSQLTQTVIPCTVRSTDFPATLHHSILELANKMHVKGYLKICLFSKSDLSTAIFQRLATIQIFFYNFKDVAVHAEIPLFSYDNRIVNFFQNCEIWFVD